MPEITLNEQAIKDLRTLLDQFVTARRRSEGNGMFCDPGPEDRLRALLPYEPSEQDITDYLAAHGWNLAVSLARAEARHQSAAMRDRGYEVRRIEADQ